MWMNYDHFFFIEIKADDIYSEDDSSLSEDDPDSPSQPERGVYITDQSAAIMRPSSRQSRRPTSMPMAHARRDNGTAKPEKIDRKVQKLGKGEEYSSINSRDCILQ